jgi:uncharacterized repeat protein (TIGR03803 family)
MSKRRERSDPTEIALAGRWIALLREDVMATAKLSAVPIMLCCALLIALAPHATAADKEKVLYRFSGTDGAVPRAGVTLDAAGNLYGTASVSESDVRCESDSCGVVFELSPDTNGEFSEKVLYTFGNDGKDGEFPLAGLIFDTTGNLYGTTSSGGGSSGCGVVFRLTPGANGKWTERVLHSFGTGCPNEGFNPTADVVFDAAGNLFGTVKSGGQYGVGTAFELMPEESGEWSFTLLHNFGDGNDFGNPSAGMILDTAGNLYGTTVGEVFELKSGANGWVETVLYDVGSLGGLTFDSSGNLYGTTLVDGEPGCGSYGECGAVFELTPQANGTWTETILKKFPSSERYGFYPAAGVIFDPAGNLYGTTELGGAYGYGTVFELIPGANGKWTEKLLHSFAGGDDGAYPYAGVVLDAAGNLYGTTSNGGDSTCDFGYGCGTVYEITP